MNTTPKSVLHPDMLFVITLRKTGSFHTFTVFTNLKQQGVYFTFYLKENIWESKDLVYMVFFSIRSKG